MAVCNITPRRKLTESEEMDSVLYGELTKTLNIATARNVYDNLHSEDFIEWFGADWTSRQDLENTYVTGEPKLIEGGFVNLKGERLEIGTVKKKVDKELLYGNTLKTLLENQRIDKREVLNDGMPVPIALDINKNIININQTSLDKTKIPLGFARMLLLLGEGTNALSNLRNTIESEYFERVEEVRKYYGIKESVDQVLLETFKSKQSKEVEASKNTVIRVLSEKLDLEGGRTRELLTSMVLTSFDKENNIEEEGETVTSLSDISSLKDKELSFDFDKDLIDIEKERIAKGYSKRQVYQEGEAKPDYSLLERLIRTAEVSTLGADLINSINTNKISRGKLNIITSLPLKDAIASRLGIDSRLVISSKDAETIQEYNLDKDTTVEEGNKSDSMSKLEEQAEVSKRQTIANSLQGVTHITSDVNTPVSESISYVSHTDSEKARGRMGETTYAKMLNVVETERIALQKRLNYYKTRSKVTNSTSKAVKEIEDTITLLEEKETNEQYLILVKKAGEDLSKLESFLRNDKNFETYSDEALFNLSFINQFIDSYSLLDNQEFSNGNEDLKNHISSLNESLNFIEAEYDRRNNQTLASLFESVTSNPKLKGNYEGILELLEKGKDIGIVRANASSMGVSEDIHLSLFHLLHSHNITKANNKAHDLAREITYEDKKLKEAGIKDTDFMINKETATFVDKTSERFHTMVKKSREKIEGLKFKEIPLGTLSASSSEHIEYNKELARNRDEANSILKPEIFVKETGQFIDGENKKYTDKFKKERSKYETYDSSARKWVKKQGVSEGDYFSYMQRNYNDSFTTLRAIKKGKEYTGETELTSYRFPKESNVEVTDKWQSSKYKEILSSPAKLRYYTFMNNLMEETLKKLPSNFQNTMQGRLPAMRKHLLDSIKDSPFKAKAVIENLKSSLVPEAILKNAATDENGERIESIPLLYVGELRDEAKIALYKKNRDTFEKGSEDYQEWDRKFEMESKKMPPSEVENNVTDSIMAFTQAVAHYEIMLDFEPTVHAVKQSIENKSYYETDSNGRLIPDGNDFRRKSKNKINVSKQLNDYLEQVFYQSVDINDDLGGQIAKKLMKLSSFRNLGLNVQSALNNVTMAKVLMYMDSLGGEFFTLKEYRKATNIVNKELVSSKRLSAISKRDFIPKTKLDAMMLDWRLIQDTKEAGDFRSTIDGKKAFIDGRWMFILQDAGEYKVQSDLAVSMMVAEKIKLNDGTEISMWDAHELRDGKFLLKEELKAKTSFGDKDKMSFSHKILSVNKRLNGMYTQEDKIGLQKHWVGQMAYHYKKWLPNAFDRRFRKEYFDESTQVRTEGRYRTVGGYITSLYLSETEKDGITSAQLSMSEKLLAIANMRKHMRSNYKGLSKHQKANMIKTGFEAAAIVASAISIYALTALAGDVDDEDVLAKRSINFLISQNHRLDRELWTFLSPQEMVNTAKNPFASLGMLKEVQELGKAALGEVYLPEEKLYYTKGVYKGRRKSIKELLDNVPVLQNINKIDRLDKTEDYFIK